VAHVVDRHRAERAETIRPVARRICSGPAIEVPPNFFTTMSLLAFTDLRIRTTDPGTE
jgi:hypothetical protein